MRPVTPQFKKTPFRVTIDDLGLFAEVEDSVLELCGRGFPIHASWLTNFSAPSSSYFAKQKGIGNGLHFNVLEGRGTLKRSTLVNDKGRFCKNWWDFLFPLKQLKTDVAEELENQILIAKGWFGTLSHLDSHLHLHAIPWIHEIFKSAAERHNVPFIRNPVEPWGDSRSFQPKLLLLELLQGIRKQRELPCYGISATFEIDAKKCFDLIAQGRSREFVFHTCLKVPAFPPEDSRFVTRVDMEKRFNEHLQLSLFLDLIGREA